MKKLVVANWKDLPPTLQEAREIVARIAGGDNVVLCPPFAFAADIAGALPAGAQLGAQDMDAAQIVPGTKYVIIGHSDRRWKLGESDEVTNAKLKDVLAAGMTPIVCLGERSRAEGWRDELMAQMKMTFYGLTPGQIAHCLIAYEPVWAISTNPDAKPDTPASAVHSMSLIRESLAENFDVSAPTFLYGGSVRPGNAADFLSRPEISGVLVGGASVRPEEFNEIVTIANQ